MPIYNRQIPEEKKPRYSLFADREIISPESLQSLEPMGIEPSKKISLFSPSAASPDQFGDANKMVDTEPKKKGFGTKFKEFFTGQDVPGGVDEFGIRKPDSHKDGIGGKILNYLLPFLFGATGAPVAAALSTSYFGQKAGKGMARQGELENYQKQRSLKQKEAASKLIVSPFEREKLGWEQEKFFRDQEAKEADRAAKLDKENAGDKLPATQSVLLADGKQIPGLIDNLEKTFNNPKYKDIGGPISGYRGLNPYDTDAQALQSEINSVKQFVGKFLEGGVLRKEDEAKYDKIMPTMKDTPEVRAQKAKILKEMVQEKYNLYLDSFKKSGYNVGSYEAFGNKPSASSVTQPNAPRQSMTPVPPPDEKAAAIQWAKTNPNDPNAKLILQHAGGA